MLIVSPGCCGRNTAEITKIKGYEERFFYLEISETDLVTGRHLKVIPQAVAEIVESCRVQPSLVMICITCVDALLGTDMERVARKAETLVQIPVRPCYMYALTREGRRPPMAVALLASAQAEAHPFERESARLLCTCRSGLRAVWDAAGDWREDDPADRYL